MTRKKKRSYLKTKPLQAYSERKSQGIRGGADKSSPWERGPKKAGPHDLKGRKRRAL